MKPIRTDPEGICPSGDSPLGVLQLLPDAP